MNAILDLNRKRAEASSWRNRIVGAAGVIGTVIGVGTTAAAVVATGPFSVPAFIAGSRFLATSAILGGGLVGGITTARSVGGAFDAIRGHIANRIPWFMNRRVTQ